ncbi:MAG: DUF1080 domain-containing protein [Planctomycetes bacterium]|nr:DUF1080 domain-containing protein [Planctomycetota bacterium]
MPYNRLSWLPRCSRVGAEAVTWTIRRTNASASAQLSNARECRVRHVNENCEVSAMTRKHCLGPVTHPWDRLPACPSDQTHRVPAPVSGFPTDPDGCATVADLRCRPRSMRWWSAGRRILAAAALLVWALRAQTTCGQGPGGPAEPAAERGDKAAVKVVEGTDAPWQSLFDGKTLKGWKSTNFGGEGQVHVENGVLVLEMGSSLTGITWTGEFPKCDYEVRAEAMRIEGIDFFCTMTFPVQESFCSLVVGGWAGAVVGISCIDNADASLNETTRFERFESRKWYRVRVEVREHRIRAWIDDKPMVDVVTKGRKLATRSEVELSKPFGITSWETRAGLRNIQVRRLPPPPRDAAEK